MKAIANRFKRSSYRRAHALMVRSGQIINHKRIYRPWRFLSLCLSRKKPKKEPKRRDPIAMLPECPNHVRTYDFMFDGFQNGRRLKILTLEDEFTPEGLALRLVKSITAKDIICTLADLFSELGAPMYLRSDNRAEFVEKALKRWLAKSGTDTIEPGKSWQNGFVERFNSKVRDEFLNMGVFYTLAEAQAKVSSAGWSTTAYVPAAVCGATLQNNIDGTFFAGLNSVIVPTPSHA